MSEFAEFVHRIYIGAKVADHPAEEDYLQLYDDFTAGKRDVADRIADEIQVLKQYQEHDLARTMIITLAHDALLCFDVEQLRARIATPVKCLCVCGCDSIATKQDEHGKPLCENCYNDYYGIAAGRDDADRTIVDAFADGM